MHLYVFRSESTAGLRAFAEDVAGAKLPDQYRPWQAIGVVKDDREPPHRLSRATIEAAIGAHGFQLWRMKAASSAADQDG